MSSGFDARGPGAGGLEFHILGPLEVWRDGVRVDLGPPKQRAVLAVLLLSANRVVPTDRLIDQLWGEAPPNTARAALQVYVAGLRKALGNGHATLTTRAPGYVLEVEPGALDLERFDGLRSEARATADPVGRSALLHEALALWRDAPLTEFDGEPFAESAAAQLEERHLAALEERIDADLALGRHAVVVSELDALVGEQPYRERFRAQQMLALYRSGRQADALAAYRAAREAFATGLGIEPGAELKSLERGMLEQDPTLDAPHHPAPEAAAPPSPPVRRGGRRAWLVGLASLLAAAGLVVVVLRARDDASAIVAPPNSVAVIDPDTNTVVKSIQVGIRPGPITAGAGFAWVGNMGDRNLTKIDIQNQTFAGTVPLDERTPTGLAFDRGVVWVAHGLLGSVSRVSAQFGDVVGVTPVTEKGIYSSTGSIAAGDVDAIWAVFGDATLARLDRATGAVTRKTSTDASPTGLAVGYGSIWVSSAFRSTVQRFSPLSLAEVQRVTVGSRPAAIAAGFGDVWVTSSGGDLVYRVDIGGGSIAATIPVGDSPTAIAVGVDAVWVANSAAGTVSRIDPETNRPVETIEVGEAPAGLVVAGNLVWVTVQAR